MFIDAGALTLEVETGRLWRSDERIGRIDRDPWGDVGREEWSDVDALVEAWRESQGDPHGEGKDAFRRAVGCCVSRFPWPDTWS